MFNPRLDFLKLFGKLSARDYSASMATSVFAVSDGEFKYIRPFMLSGIFYGAAI